MMVKIYITIRIKLKVNKNNKIYVLYENIMYVI